MPQSQQRNCATPTCPGLVRGRERYCEACRAKGKRNRSPDRRPSAARRGYGYRWQQYTAHYLQGHRFCIACEMLGREDRLATVVDHIQPVSRGGDFWDPTNHQGLCVSCHNSKTAREQREERTMETTDLRIPPVTLVCGPPGSGKSTYVAEHKMPADLILDLDALAQALSGEPIHGHPATVMPFVFEARDAVLAKLRQPSKLAHAWIITMGARRTDRVYFRQSHGAYTVVLEIPAITCLRRIRDDPTRGEKWEQWEKIIDDWWATYEPAEDNHIERE